MLPEIAPNKFQPLPLRGPAGIVDSFVVDKVVRARGAKFFIEKLRNFAGHIPSKL